MPQTIQKLATHALNDAGQSPWLDSISREMLSSGFLKDLVKNKGILGLTSNPSIFQQAFAQGKGLYSADIQRLAKQGKSAFEIYDTLSIKDIQDACDILNPVYVRTQKEHGYVSLEVSPTLAHCTEKTLSEARRLWKRVARANLMIKVPATPEGIPAFRDLISEGINVNVTLIFTLDQYRQVAEAYLEGLQLYTEQHGNSSKVRSVASVFVSRFDTLIDRKLEELSQNARSNHKEAYLKLRGQAALANSRLIYQEFRKIFASSSFNKLVESGGKVQRLLWGSTSCKNPAYSDLMYVENLVGADTVNTMPQITVEALLDHGKIVPESAASDLSEVRSVIRQLNQWGLDLNQIGNDLQVQGLRQFCDAFDELMKTLERVCMTMSKKSRSQISVPVVRTTLKPDDQEAWSAAIREFDSRQGMELFIKQDPRLWKEDSDHQKVIANRLGWLKVHETMLGKLHDIEAYVQDMQKSKMKFLILLGMGGSSLAPEVMSLICKRSNRTLKFRIVDTTDPQDIRDVEKGITMGAAHFLVASKSGSTIETLSQFQYFYQKVSAFYGKKATPQEIGGHFTAITDPGSSLESLARKKHFRKVFLNPADIGGRYSALSLFGLVPAALMGIDYRGLLDAARRVYEAQVSSTGNTQKCPGVGVGLLLGALAKKGKDKLTLVTSPSLESFGAWLEQLIAESTGKEKRGVLPVDSEVLGDVSDYGEDRVFLVFKLKNEPLPKISAARMIQLKRAKFPVIEVEWSGPEALGCEFLSWEIATAASSTVLGVNPFDEPNVTESKQITLKFLDEIRKGKMPENPTRYFYLKKTVEWGLILKQIRKTSYVVLLAYLPRNAANQKAFAKLRQMIRRHFKVPVLFGFGPRYLHSIGQFYKGGTPSGLFMEFFIQDRADAAIPDQPYTFGQLKRAQGLGDFEAIQNKGLPIIAVDLGLDSVKALRTIETQIAAQLSRAK